MIQPTESSVNDLARQMVPCPVEWRNYLHPDACCTNGQVPKYPTLLERCPSKTHNPCSKEFAYQVQGMQYYEQIDIRACDGGYVVTADTGKLWEVAVRLPAVPRQIVIEYLERQAAPFEFVVWWMHLTEPERQEHLSAAILAMEAGC